ncbi:MAG: hypothetical protein K0R68_1422 [Mycobacterium sp.]|nr:hypothetical protein [Mycobacterium sp.]
MNELFLTALTVLAEEAPPRNTGPEFGKASPFGLLVVVLLLIGTFGLVWSMNRHLKRLPESFDPEHPEPDQAVDDGTVEAGSAGAGPDDTRPAGANPPPREPGG